MASITKRGDNYRIRVSIGRDINGKQLFKSTTFRPDPALTEKQTQKALQEFVIDFERQVKSGNYMDGETITFAAFVEKWRKYYATEYLQATTIEFYDFLLKKHVLPAIGHIKVAHIRPAHLLQFYDKLEHTRKTPKSDKDPGFYSKTTVKRCHACISSILQTAVYWDVIKENPCRRVRTPRAAKAINDVKYFTPEESAIFLDFLDQLYNAGDLELQHLLLFHLALFCGLRRGEIMALKWDDINFERRQVKISKSAAIVHGKIINKVPKNTSSYRLVSIPPSVVSIAKEYKAEQWKYRLSLGTQWAGDNFLFIQWDGKQMYPSTPYDVFKRIIRLYNATAEPYDQLPDIPFHGLRHTSATLLISQNVDVKTVSGRLGHAQTSTTMNIYSHALMSKDQGAADLLDDLFYGKEQESG